MCLTNRSMIGNGLPKSKLKLFILLCLTFGCYVLILQNSSFLNKFHWNFLLASNLRATIFHGHRVGTKTIQNRPNGTSIVYFHLPSLDDYKIQDDYFQFNKTLTDKLTSSQSSNILSCLRRGSQVVQSNLIGFQTCICNANYFGQNCSVPRMIQNVLQQNSELKIVTLNKPRRLLMSLIWLSHHQQNSTLDQINLENLYRTLDEFSPLIDMFIINDIIFESPRNNFSLQTQFNHGLLSKFKSFTFLNTIEFNDKRQYDENFRHIEWESMRQSWRIFSTQVTEYRPADLLIFMSINQFPATDLVLFLKYHTGIQDVVHIGPTYNFHYQNKSLMMFDDYQRSSSNETIKINNPVNSMLDHIKNVIISFQYMASLCQFSFEHYIANYCRTNQNLIKHFQTNFWSLHYIRIGSKIASPATKVIL